MLRPFIWISLVSLSTHLGAAELEFDLLKHVNELPPGFRSTLTGTGKPGEWRVIMDEAPSALPPLIPSAPAVARKPVLAQLDRSPTDEHFPLLVYEKET